MHVVDATLFYSPTSGGVKRYLLAKHEWMRAHTNWRHSLVVPGETQHARARRRLHGRGSLVPGAFNYRLPLNPLRWARAIDALEPDLIEVGDAFHPAWAAANVASRRGIPLIAFYHSNFPQLAGRRLGRGVQKFIEWYVRLTYERCEQVLAPSRYMCDYLHSIGVAHATCQPLGVDVDTFTPERATRDLRAELNLPRDTRLLVFAGRFSAEKNIPVLIDGVPPARRSLSPAVDRRRAVGGRDGNVTRIPVLPRQSRARQLLRVGRCLRACRHARNFRAGDARSHGLRAAGGRACAPARFRNSSMNAPACWRSRTRTRTLARATSRRRHRRAVRTRPGCARRGGARARGVKLQLDARAAVAHGALPVGAGFESSCGRPRPGARRNHAVASRVRPSRTISADSPAPTSGLRSVPTRIWAT